MSVLICMLATMPIHGVDRGTMTGAPAPCSVSMPVRKPSSAHCVPMPKLRYNFNNGADKRNGHLNQATIELGGFRVGVTDSQFTSWTGYLG